MTPKLIGPFSEIVTMEGLPNSGPISDFQLNIVKGGGIEVQNGLISKIGPFEELKKNHKDHENIGFSSVALPGFIDAHTHLCYGGKRSSDYAKRLASMTYLEIAKQGGGILETVEKTRSASKEELKNSLLKRLDRQLFLGVTTVEIKSGYGLTVSEELKMLEAIDEASKEHKIHCIPTCLAAHILPLEFSSPLTYLSYLMKELLPKVKERNLADRVDIFVEESAFGEHESLIYLNFAKKLGFDITVHADQFHPLGSSVASKVGAISADHLEASEERDLKALKEAKVIPVVLPGACIGLGLPFPKARKILDLNLPLVIASDWNPGSAPMGNLLAEAAILGAFEKLTMAETFAALTFRAARALNLHDRGRLAAGQKADFAIFETDDYKDILYHQGSLTPKEVYINGILSTSKTNF